MEKLWGVFIIVQTNLLNKDTWTKLTKLVLIKSGKGNKTLLAFISAWLSVAKFKCCESRHTA